MTYLYNGKLNELDKSIAQKIEDDPYFFVDHNIFESSDYLDISASKLTKYCQKIGLTGYKELKYKIRTSIEQSKYLVEGDGENSFVLLAKFVDEACLVNLFSLPKLLHEKKRVVIIAGYHHLPLAQYMAKRLRQTSGKDVVAYEIGESYQHEYRSADVIAVVIDDEKRKIEEEMAIEATNYNVSIIHIAPYGMKITESYLSIKISEDMHSLPYDAKLFMIISWLIKFNTYV